MESLQVICREPKNFIRQIWLGRLLLGAIVVVTVWISVVSFNAYLLQTIEFPSFGEVTTNILSVIAFVFFLILLPASLFLLVVVPPFFDKRKCLLISDDDLKDLRTDLYVRWDDISGIAQYSWEMQWHASLILGFIFPILFVWLSPSEEGIAISLSNRDEYLKQFPWFRGHLKVLPMLAKWRQKVFKKNYDFKSDIDEPQILIRTSDLELSKKELCDLIRKEYRGSLSWEF